MNRSLDSILDLIALPIWILNSFAWHFTERATRIRLPSPVHESRSKRVDKVRNLIRKLLPALLRRPLSFSSIFSFIFHIFSPCGSRFRNGKVEKSTDEADPHNF